jgi:hypothetical protein
VRIVIVLALALQMLTACAVYPQPYTDSGCCGDYVWYDGIRYSAHNELYSFDYGRSIADSDIGTEQFRVRQSLKGRTYFLVGPNLPADGGDGEAAVIPAGEPVYSVRGYGRTFRLAARHDERLVLYEADMNRAAKTGADVLDLDGRVVAISVLRGPTKSDPMAKAVARITDPRQVGDLTRLVLTAPVRHSESSGGLYALVGFELADGTVTGRWYAHDRGIFSTFGGPRAGGYTIHVGGAFRRAIEELCAPDPGSCTVTRGG